MKKQGIYCIEHIDSGKKYIGSSNNIRRRFMKHRYDLKYNKHHCVHLQRAVNKYGIESFSFYIMEETFNKTVKELHSLEKKYIDATINLYNVGSVGGGDNLTNHPDREDIIRRISGTINANLAAMTKEERKMKWGQSGQVNGRYKHGKSMKSMCPVCQTNKMSAGAKSCQSCVIYDRAGEKNSFYGKKHSAKTLTILRNNISWAKGLPPESIPYAKQYEITYPSGVSKKVYGLKAIASEFNVSIANVAMTIDRMTKGSLPTKRSCFYQHYIRIA